MAKTNPIDSISINNVKYDFDPTELSSLTVTGNLTVNGATATFNNITANTANLSVISAASITARDGSNAHITLSNAGCVISTSAPLNILHAGRAIRVNSTNFTFPIESGTIAIKETYNIPSADVGGSFLLDAISDFSATQNWKLFSTTVSFSNKYTDKMSGKCFYAIIQGSIDGNLCYAYGLVWFCDSTFSNLSGYAMLVSLKSNSVWKNSATIFGMILTAL